MAKRQEAVCKRVYLDSDKTEYHNMPADPSVIVAQQFRFTNGEVRVIDIDDFSDAVAIGATWHGFNQTHGDVFAGVKGDVEEAISLFDARHNTLTGGVWTSRTGGGTASDTILVEAVVATYADNNIEKDATVIRGYFLCEDLVGTDEEVKAERKARRAKWMKRADTAEHYATIKADRDAKKAKTDPESEEAVEMLYDIPDSDAEPEDETTE